MNKITRTVKIAKYEIIVYDSVNKVTTNHIVECLSESTKKVMKKARKYLTDKYDGRYCPLMVSIESEKNELYVMDVDEFIKHAKIMEGK